jgi:hypothetical protein
MGGRGRDEVVFRDEELLGILSWPDTRESRLSMETSAERYYNAAFHRTSRESLGEGRGEWVSSEVQKLVRGYDMTQEWEVGTPRGKRKLTTLRFSRNLVESLTGSERFFLGLDFERLQLERIRPEASERHTVAMTK